MEASHVRPQPALLLILAFLASPPTVAAQLFINELHYDNAGSDRNEGVEIAGPAGLDLGAYDLVLYNGANGAPYATVPLSGLLPNESATGFGAAFFAVAGLQNGSPDGLALVDRSTAAVQQFLSYEGQFQARGGPADGLTSEDIGVSESSRALADHSLQLRGSGSQANDFRWAAPSTASPGRLNFGQTLSGQVTPILAVVPSLRFLPEDGSVALTLTFTVSPTPSAPVTLGLSSSQPSRLPVPAEVQINEAGTRTLTLTPIDNTIIDSDNNLIIEISDTGGTFANRLIPVTLIDDDRKAPEPTAGEPLRVASFNVLNGVGVRGSASYDAVAAQLRRIDADVLTFQEVSSTGNFRALKTLLADLGFRVDRQYFAALGDGFENQTPVNGQFPSDQFVAIASRYPITRTIQVGRGVPGRQELTRYPLYAAIDVPGTEADPHLVVVHLKAGRLQSDQFRKALEARRIVEFLESQNLASNEANVIVLGDFNENRAASNFHASSFRATTRQFSDGSSLPASFRVGSDLTDPPAVLRYRTFPDSPFAAAGLRVLPLEHADQERVGTFISPGEDAALDYVLVSQPLRSRPLHGEIFNSLFDQAYDGLPKSGAPVSPSVSSAASDHYLLFADVFLDPLPSLTLSFSKESGIDEAGDSAMGLLTLEAPLAEPLTATVSAAGFRALPEQVIVPAGAQQASFAFLPVPDGVSTPDRLATVTAAAPGFAPAYATLQRRNTEASGHVLFSQIREPGAMATGRGGRASQ